jgi:AcrR family transcriptional regulator
MPVKGNDDPRTRRRAQRRAEILDAAWTLAHEHGISAVSLHEVARLVGLRQPSLYVHFGSKRDLYDAMFAQGFAALVEERQALRLPDDPKAALIIGCRHFVTFCVRDPARYQLLFQRPIPGFEPSPESMRVSGEALSHLERWLAAAGAPGTAGVDLARALLTGLAGEQIANEPGGKRWTRQVDAVVEVLLEVLHRRKPPSRKGRKRA